jgi:hypothetical protein
VDVDGMGFVCVQVMLEAGEGFVALVPGEREQTGPRATHVRLDRSKVRDMLGMVGGERPICFYPQGLRERL